MNEELKYPIKYAVLELKVAGGYPVGYKDITRGFIVSKCYVVESFIKYFSNGNSKLSHKVVFPYKEISDFETGLRYGIENIGEHVIPSYNYFNEPYPVDIVSEVFDNYEDANKVAKEKNEELYSKLHANLFSYNYNKDLIIKNTVIEELLENFYERLSICQKFEQLVSIQTEAMAISKYDNSNQLRLIKKKND